MAFLSAAEYGRTLHGLTLNLIVRDVGRSLPFYRDVLGFEVLHEEEAFAALRGHGTQVQLHADATYRRMPWAPDLAGGVRRGLGAEVRILGVDPDAAERRARDLGFDVLIETREWPHGWREVYLVDPDGYTFSVGVATEPG